jgi:hypothetical protein
MKPVAALLSAIVSGCPVVEAVAQTTAGSETSQFIVSLEQSSSDDRMPFSVFGEPVIDRHPQWERYRSSLAKFPSLGGCLLPTAMVANGWDLSAFNWAGLEDHRDIEVCAFRVAASLETSERMRAWLVDQGYLVHGPILTTPNVTGEGPNDSDVGLSGILAAEEFETRTRFRRSLNPLGYVWEWLFPSPPNHRDHALNLIYSGQGRIVAIQSGRRGG